MIPLYFLFYAAKSFLEYQNAGLTNIKEGETYKFEFFPNGNYDISIEENHIIFENEEPIEFELLDDLTFLANGENKEISNTIRIIRRNTNAEKINLHFTNFKNPVTVEFDCDDSTKAIPFTLCYYSLDKTKILTNAGTCNDVHISIKEPENPDEPDKPNPDEPDKTNPDEPDKTNPDEPDKTNPDEPDKPNPDDPDKTNPEDPDKPNPDDPDKTNPDEPDRTPPPTLTPSPSNSYPPPPASTKFSFYSKSINLTTTGFINETNDHVELDDTLMNIVIFNETSITVYENEALNPSSTLFLTANHDSSLIIINEDVNKSNIGVTSDKSPTIELHKSTNPLSFFHDDENGSQISLNSTENENDNINLVLNEVNNRKGLFSLQCLNDTIETVSFSSIVMSHHSKFQILKPKKSEKILLETFSEEKILLETFSEEIEKESVPIFVRNKIEIEPESRVSLDNFNLSGKLVIHDDSKLKVLNEASFQNGSEIEFIIGQRFDLNETLNSEYNKIVEPAISFQGELKSPPSKVVLSSGKSGTPIDVVDFPIFKAEKSENCTQFSDLFAFESGKEGKISFRCDEEDERMLLLSAEEKVKEKKKSKLSAGVIAGIVIAALFVVGMIIALIVYYTRRNKKTHDRNVDEEEDDSNSVGL